VGALRGLRGMFGTGMKRKFCVGNGEEACGHVHTVAGGSMTGIDGWRHENEEPLLQWAFVRRPR
jgi:hypothetical protein